MSIVEKYSSPIHWRYFLSLESDLDAVAKYIEFSTPNFNVYSTALASMLLSAASEVDVIAKLLCRKINKSSKAKNIGHYANQIVAKYPSITSQKIEIPKYDLHLQPWINWAGKAKRRPDWWAAYNNVKHERDKHFDEANLKNVINALGGLFIITLYYYSELAKDGKLAPNPGLFRPKGDYNVTFWDTEALIEYELGV